MVNFIIEAAIVALSSYLIAKKYFKEYFLADFTLTWFILILAQIVLVQLFLGIAGKLYFFNVFFAELLILIFAAVFLNSFKGGISFIRKPSIEVFMQSKPIILGFSVFSAFFAVKFYINLINPPMYPDSMQYGLFFPASWINSGTLENPFQIFGSTPILNPSGFETGGGTYYPINALLIFNWLMMPLRNAFLADVGEVPFYIMGILAVYSILRKFDVDKPLSLLSGFLLFLMPNILKHLRNGAQFDVICAVLFLLVINTFLLLEGRFSFRNGLIFGTATGLFVGTKVININWLLSLSPFIIYVFLNQLKSRRVSLLKFLGIISLIVSMVVLFGGYMYFKNYLHTANPLFPYHIKIFGKMIFKGILDNADYKMQVAPDNLNFAKIMFKEGLGFQFAALIFPATFLPLLLIAFVKKKFEPFVKYLLLFMAPVIMVISYITSVNLATMRYLYSYFAFGLIISVIFVNKFKWGKKYISFVALISIISGSFNLANGYELVTAIILSILLFVFILMNRKKIISFYKGSHFTSAIVVFVLLLIPIFIFLNNRYNLEEFNRYPGIFKKKEAWQKDIGYGWKALNDLTGKGARVAYTGRQEAYPLYGTGLKNYVKYVSVNSKDITPYNNPDGLYREKKNFSSWRENLRKEGVEYLFVARPFFVNRESEDPNKFPIEDEWAIQHPDEFKLMFSNSMSRIYKVNIR